jgi:hypothetical protein
VLEVELPQRGLQLRHRLLELRRWLSKRYTMIEEKTKTRLFDVRLSLCAVAGLRLCIAAALWLFAVSATSTGHVRKAGGRATDGMTRKDERKRSEENLPYWASASCQLCM